MRSAIKMEVWTVHAWEHSVCNAKHPQRRQTKQLRRHWDCTTIEWQFCQCRQEVDIRQRYTRVVYSSTDQLGINISHNELFFSRWKNMWYMIVCLRSREAGQCCTVIVLEYGDACRPGRGAVRTALYSLSLSTLCWPARCGGCPQRGSVSRASQWRAVTVPAGGVRCPRQLSIHSTDLI